MTGLPAARDVKRLAAGTYLERRILGDRAIGIVRSSSIPPSINRNRGEKVSAEFNGLARFSEIARRTNWVPSSCEEG
jgi:hypothetical protein